MIWKKKTRFQNEENELKWKKNFLLKTMATGTYMMIGNGMRSLFAKCAATVNQFFYITSIALFAVCTGTPNIQTSSFFANSVSLKNKNK